MTTSMGTCSAIWSLTFSAISITEAARVHNDGHVYHDPLISSPEPRRSLGWAAFSHVGPRVTPSWSPVLLFARPSLLGPEPHPTPEMALKIVNIAHFWSSCHPQ